MLKTSLKKNTFLTLLLWGIWLVLVEDLTFAYIIAGFFVSIISVLFAHRYLPLRPIKNVNFFRLLFWPFHLLLQIYLAAFDVIKAILTDCKVEIVAVETSLKVDTLRTMLSRAATITPGSILVNLKDNKLTIMWLRPKTAPELNDKEKREALIGPLERMLLKAEVK